ncbi:MAG: hypothetical protein U0T73_11475 [Chitinophagales bacterium]
MKKLFFVFAVAAGVVMAACNNKPAESTETPAVDSTAMTQEAPAAAPADSASMSAAVDTAAAKAAQAVDATKAAAEAVKDAAKEVKK